MKYSPAIVEEILKNLRLGMNKEDSSLLAGVSRDSLFTWQKQYPDFAEAVEKAQLQCKQRCIGIIQKAAMKSWTAAAWYLERRHHTEFAEQQKFQHSGPNGQPIAITTGPKVNWEKFTDEQIEKMIIAGGAHKNGNTADAPTDGD